MQNRNDEPRLQHAPLRLPRKDDGRGRVNRRAMGVGQVSEWRKVTSQKPGGNFRQPQSEAEDRTIWPCRDHGRRSSYHRRIFFEVPSKGSYLCLAEKKRICRAQSLFTLRCTKLNPA